MPRFAFALASALSATLALAAPVSAQSMSLLLPALSFPGDTVTPSTKDCPAGTRPAVCQLDE